MRRRATAGLRITSPWDALLGFGLGDPRGDGGGVGLGTKSRPGLAYGHTRRSCARFPRRRPPESSRVAGPRQDPAVCRSGSAGRTPGPAWSRTHLIAYAGLPAAFAVACPRPGRAEFPVDQPGRHRAPHKPGTPPTGSSRSGPQSTNTDAAPRPRARLEGPGLIRDRRQQGGQFAAVTVIGTSHGRGFRRWLTDGDHVRFGEPRRRGPWLTSDAHSLLQARLPHWRLEPPIRTSSHAPSREWGKPWHLRIRSITLPGGHQDNSRRAGGGQPLAWQPGRSLPPGAGARRRRNLQLPRARRPRPLARRPRPRPPPPRLARR